MPAQIRAAYGLPPVPSDLSGITPLQAAQARGVIGSSRPRFQLAGYGDRWPTA